MTKNDNSQTLYRQNPIKKLISSIAAEDIVISVACFMLSKAVLLNCMTPFGPAFFAANFSPTGWFYALVASIGGTLVSQAENPVGHILSFALTAAILGLSDKRDKTLFKALTASVTYFTVSLFLMAADYFAFYDFIIRAFESFICFVSVYLMDSVSPVLTNYKKRTFLNHSEVMGITALAALFILSLASSEKIMGIQPASFIAIFIIMAISYKGDIMLSTTTGIIFGLALSLHKTGSASMIGAYTFTAFCTGFFRKYSRLGIVLGAALANAIITAFMNDTADMLISPVELLAAGLIFATIPLKTISVFTEFAQKASDISSMGNMYRDKLNEARQENLLHISNSFAKLGDIYRRDCYIRRPGKQYTSKLFDYVGEKVCSGCSLRFGCWQSDRQNMYTYMMSMLNKTSKTGTLTKNDLPRKFADKCTHTEQFVSCFNFMYDLYKADCIWMEKMQDYRQLMASQMDGISDIIKSISKDDLLTTDPEYEMYLRSALDNNGIQTEHLNVFVNSDDIVKIQLMCNYNLDESGIEEIISAALERPMRICKQSSGIGGYIYEICPCEKYIIRWAGAYACKSGENVCGDSYGSVCGKDGRYTLVISDGMGSGEDAMKQSRYTVDMLCSFTEAGFRPEAVHSIINSSLLLRSAKDSFTTIDSICVDLNTGRADITKIGAAPTYIKQGDVVRRIDCTTLPLGILKDMEVQKHMVDLGTHSTIVMVSDGISNSALKTNNNWIESEIKNLTTHNPAVVAEKILKKAISVSGGQADDDMTVVAAVVYKNE